MISSISNKQIKEIMNLMKKSGDRHARGLFVVEGIRMVREVPPALLDKIYVTERFAKENSLADFEPVVTGCGSAGASCEPIAGRESESGICNLVSEEVMAHMSGTVTPQGILATVRMPKYTLRDVVGTANSKPCPLVVILENIQDPGNLGTIMRSCEGAGVTGIVMSEDTVDIYNPKVVRSTMGSLFRMPFIYVKDVAEITRRLGNEGYKTYAAALTGSVPYTSVSYLDPSAILIGNEGNGLTDRAVNAASSCIRIPMNGSLESLNAAVSTAVITYEALRQRDL